MNIRSTHTYLELVVSCSLIQTEREPLGIRNPLVIHEELFVSTIGFVTTTPVLFAAPLIVLVTLKPISISDSNVGGASKERHLPFLVEMILTFYGIMSIIA
jgi:hypothetical protein